MTPDESSKSLMTIGEWRVDAPGDRLLRGEVELKLEPRLMRLLLALASQPGQVLSAEHLLAEVWPDVVVTPDSVYQAVAGLRKSLGDDSLQPSYIVTVPRKGYRLVAPVGCCPRDDGAETAIAPATPSRMPAWTLAAAGLVALLIVSGAWWQQSQKPGVAPLPPTVARILWVDDQPANNDSERNALLALGVEVAVARSTADALAALAEAPVRMIISDMQRPLDPAAGHTLLQALREQGDATPLLIYAGHCTDPQVANAQALGAIDCVSRVSELMFRVLGVIEEGA